jgi:hypothetical protein
LQPFSLLNNKSNISSRATITVLGTLRNHPYKQQLLIYDSFYQSNNNGAADIFTNVNYNDKSGYSLGLGVLRWDLQLG